jgi:hypothetical protein
MRSPLTIEVIKMLDSSANILTIEFYKEIILSINWKCKYSSVLAIGSNRQYWYSIIHKEIARIVCHIASIKTWNCKSKQEITRIGDIIISNCELDSIGTKNGTDQ